MHSKSKCVPQIDMEVAKQFQCCLVGGTFDRFHSGHSLLLLAACRESSKVEVHISNDDMASKKSPYVEDYETRVEHILDWASQNNILNMQIFPLSDNYGPAPEHKTADCIVATQETIHNCEQINNSRIENNLPILKIIEVPHIIDFFGKILSSSRIRSGVVDTDGNPWIDKTQRENIVKMVSKLDGELKTPMGQIFSGPGDLPEVAMSSALESLPEKRGSIIAVGDVTVKTLLDMEIIPDIGLIDGMTKRTALLESEIVDMDHFDEIKNAINPAGCLTPSLLNAIEDAISSQNSVVINVEGEEDLAPLYIHCLAPIGSVVLYGQPNVGVVSQISTLSVKERCREILSMFEVA